MTKLNRTTLALLAAPLALGLASCGDDADTGTAGGDGTETIAEGSVVQDVAAPEGSSWMDTVVRTDAGGWLMGNPDAPIKLIEYGSVTCPACAAFAANGMEQLKSDYVESGRVAYEFRSVPIHGAMDLVLTRLLECAPVEAGPALADQIWLNLDQVTGGVQRNGQAVQDALTLPPEQRLVAFAERAGFYDFFKARGLGEEAARACLADNTAAENLANKLEEVNSADNVSRTPTFFVNGSEVQASQWPELEPILQRAGARAQ